MSGLFFFLFFIPVLLCSYTLDFSDGLTSRTEIDLVYESGGGMGFNIRVNRVRVENTVVNNNPMHSIIIPELYSLKHPGEPLLPSISRMIAIPQNSRLEVRITGSRKTVTPMLYHYATLNPFLKIPHIHLSINRIPVFISGIIFILRK